MARARGTPDARGEVMARVNVDAVALVDPRFVKLGRLLHTDRHGALGRMIQVWLLCTERERYEVDANEIIDLDIGLTAALIVEAELGVWTDDAQSRIRVCGTAGRIEWLAKKRRSGAKGGKSTQQQIRELR